MLTIAADPKHLGARIGFLSVLHSWGSPMTHPLLAVPVLSELFRGLCLQKLRAAYRAGELQFFGKHARLIDPRSRG
jgi:hypothetical protein